LSLGGGGGGGVNNTFKKCIDYLASEDGLFIPASDLLDILNENKRINTVPFLYLCYLDFKWIIERF